MACFIFRSAQDSCQLGDPHDADRGRSDELRELAAANSSPQAEGDPGSNGDEHGTEQETPAPSPRASRSRSSRIGSADPLGQRGVWRRQRVESKSDDVASARLRPVADEVDHHAEPTPNGGHGIRPAGRVDPRARGEAGWLRGRVPAADH